jgi:hypothetical protein
VVVEKPRAGSIGTRYVSWILVGAIVEGPEVARLMFYCSPWELPVAETV